jgi:hypothetical protein
VTLSGAVIGAPKGVSVQIDLVDLDPDRSNKNNPILGSARFDNVDTFEMPAPKHGVFGVRIYLDQDGDGPSAGDPLFTLLEPAFEANGESIRGVILDLNTEKIRWATPQPTK